MGRCRTASIVLLSICDAFRLDAVNTILQKLVVRIAIADEVKMPIHVNNVIGVYVLVSNALVCCERRYNSKPICWLFRIAFSMMSIVVR